MIDLPDRYKDVKKVLKGGGMSETLLCHDAHLDRDVVIKSLKAGVSPKRLLDELAALSAIRSKNVVQVYDVVRDSSGAIIAIVEEYLSGASIDGIALKTADEAYRVLYPISAGIADIHAHGRVHRDIKPNNMRRDVHGCLKIYDFGLAKMHVPDGATKSLYFTPGYTAPETFVANKNGEYPFTRAVDVFAFGATAYSLLTGGLPGPLLKMPPDIVTAKCNFSKCPQGLPKDISDVLNACFSEAPEDRPKIGAVKRLLAQYLLFNQHRASIILNEKEHVLHAGNKYAGFKLGAEAEVGIQYDGFAFKVSHVMGPVAINNMAIQVGFELPGACIIVLGDGLEGRRRGMVQVAVSHPEVTL